MDLFYVEGAHVIIFYHGWVFRALHGFDKSLKVQPECFLCLFFVGGVEDNYISQCPVEGDIHVLVISSVVVHGAPNFEEGLDVCGPGDIVHARWG